MFCQATVMRKVLPLLLMTILLAGLVPALAQEPAQDAPSSELALGRDEAPAEPLRLPSSALIWNTFLGGTDVDYAVDTVTDDSGYLYVTGFSDVTWGAPLRGHSGNSDAFVAKLDANGNLIWHTFLGGPGSDVGHDIVMDASGNLYIAGDSNAGWGVPVRDHTGDYDAFVARLDGDGNLTWNTFLGGLAEDLGRSIGVDGSGHVYAVGRSYGDWGSPLREYSAGEDAFAIKLDGDGALIWHTFLGGTGLDNGDALALDRLGNLYVAGFSNDSWGIVMRAYSGGWDAYVAKVDADGQLLWNIFLGSEDDDEARGLAVGGSGDLYVAGQSYANWGVPRRPFSGAPDAFVAKVDGWGYGAVIWNTFLGGGAYDRGRSTAVDSNVDIYVSGDSEATWGSPLRAYSGGRDAFAAKLNSAGELIWNAFLGASGFEEGTDIFASGHGDVYAAGVSGSTWGVPQRAHTGNKDGFVVSLGQPCFGDGVYLYEDANYGGRCRKFTDSESNLALLAFDDIASSIDFAGSYGGGRYVARLYEKVGYAGDSSAFRADDTTLGDNAIGHNRASSIQIQRHVEIMPMGDSITAGVGGTQGGYRGYLQTLLKKGGWHADFVGRVQSGPGDKDHEGHTGWFADKGGPGWTDDVVGQAYNWLANAYVDNGEHVDVVLLHIGTEDISAGDDGATVADDVNKILDEIDRFEADRGTEVQVILASIINRGDGADATTTAYNQALRAMAVRRIQNGDDLIVVEMESALNYEDDMSNVLHPNDAGYEKMARVWYAALDDECWGDGIYLYEGLHYGGRCRKFTTNQPDLALVGFDNEAYSIRFGGRYGGGRYQVTLYWDANYKGRKSSFEWDQYDFGGWEIGPGTSSIWIERLVGPGERIYLPLLSRHY